MRSTGTLETPKGATLTGHLSTSAQMKMPWLCRLGRMKCLEIWAAMVKFSGLKSVLIYPLPLWFMHRFLSLRPLALLILFTLASAAKGALVSEGPGGLVYTPYANQGQVSAVNTVPDFSRAGYGGGGVPIPFVPAVVTISDGPGDDRALIQNAIDQVSALPLGPDGFRGAVLLRAGEYTVDSTLSINASGVVIRGEGQQESGGTRITYTATNKSDLFRFSGSGGPDTVGGSSRDIADTLVPVGAKTLNVTDASPFSAGDLIRVTNTVNQDWIDAIGMNVVSPAWTPDGFELEFFRFVAAVDGNELTLDAPIVQAIETQYGGGTIERLTYADAIENVGIENIRLESTFLANNDEEHGWEAIEMLRVRNGWVRQVTGRYFGRGLVVLDSSSLFITVEDCAFLDPKSRTIGGNKYSFYVDDSSYNLVQRCLTRGGRHDYVTGSKTPGPNVFVDSLATQASSDIGPHFRYATGELYDNIKTNHTIRVQNRFNVGTSHGWSGAQIMFWNVVAGGIVNDTPNGAMNWAVGAIGTKQQGEWAAAEPFGIWESEGAPVQPRSLYYAQLAERLGGNALFDVILPQQMQGTLWTDLESWDGDGLLLDPVVVVLDPSTTVGLNDPVAIRARIRDLRMLDNLNAVSWSQVSGPGATTFGDSTAIETTASFTASGQYVLQLEANDGSRQVSGLLVVDAIDQNDTTAPAAPTGLTLIPSYHRVNLDWADNGEADLGGYAVYRREASGSFDEPLVTGLGASQFQDENVTNGTTYFYQVRAQDVNGNISAPSGEASTTPFDNDPPPDVFFNEPADGTTFLLGENFAVQVAASDRDGSVANVKLNLDGQLVRQENGAPYDWSTGADAALNELMVGSYTLEAVAEDNDGQTASMAITIHIAPDIIAPEAPTGLQVAAGNGTIRLNWAENIEADLAGYAVYRRELAGVYSDPLIVGLTSPDYTDVSVANGTTYVYRVSAFDSSGNQSAFSDEASATPWAIIDFGSDPGKVSVTAAGFTTTLPAAGTESHAPDAYRIAIGDAGHANFGFLKEFPGMGGANRNDFSITLEARLVSTGEGLKNNYRYAVALFNEPGDLENSGIGAILLYDNATLQLVLREGLNGADLATADFKTVGGAGRPYDYPEGETYTFVVVGEFTGGDSLNLSFALGDGTSTASVSTTVDISQYPGNLFGGAARMRDGFIVDFDNFSMDTVGIDAAPLAPSGVVAIPGNNSVSLNWDANSEIDFAGYTVYRSLSPGVDGVAIAEGLTDRQYTDDSVQNGTTYYYQLSATDTAGNESDKSDEVLARPDLILSIDLLAADNSYVRRDNGVQDAKETLEIKRDDWGNSFARVAYIRIAMLGDDSIGGIAADDLTAASLKIYVDRNEPNDTLWLYALQDAAKFSAASLSETTWTGGVDGTPGGGHNLQGSNRPDGEFALPNALTTVELGSLTFGDGPDTGLKTLTISNLDAFRALVKADTNGELTLVLRGTRDGNPNEIASIFNTSGHPGPSLALTADAPVEPDSDADGIADDWETLYFGNTAAIDGSGDHDGDGTIDFFEYLFGTNPTDPAESGRVLVSPESGSGDLIFEWTVAEGMAIDTDYLIEFSTDLSQWDPLPAAYYMLTEDTSNGATRVQVELTHDFGTEFFLQLVRPE